MRVLRPPLPRSARAWRAGVALALAVATIGLLSPASAATDTGMPVAAQADPAIANASFEEPASGGTIPHWTPRWAGGFTVTSSPSPIPDGRRALRVSDPSSTQATGLLSDPMPITYDRSYYVRATIYPVKGGIQLWHYYYDANGVELASHSNQMSVPAGRWTQAAFHSAPPAGATRMRVMIYSAQAAVTDAYVDDLWIHSFGQVERLGSPISSVMVGGGAGANGRFYAVQKGQSARLSVIDPRTGTVEREYALTGMENGVADAAPDGTVYIAGDTVLYRLGRDGVLTRLGSPVAAPGIVWSLDVGSDGTVYGTSFQNGVPARLWRYAGGAFSSWSIATGEQYARVSVAGAFGGQAAGTSDGKAYLAMGAQRPAVLVWDLAQHRVEREIPLAGAEFPAGITTVEWVQAIGANLYVRAADGLRIYDLAGARWRPHRVNQVNPDMVSEPDAAGRVWFAVNYTLSYYDPATDTVRSTSAQSSQWRGPSWFEGVAGMPGQTLINMDLSGRFRYYNPQTGTGRNDSDSALRAMPVPIHSLGDGPDDRVYATSLPYGGLGWYDPASGGIGQCPGGVAQVEGWAAHQGRLYLGNYPFAQLLEFDPAQPCGAANPRIVADFPAGQARPYAMHGTGDLIVAGTIPDKGNLGGSLGVYNTVTGGWRVFPHTAVVPDQSITALTSRNGIVYGGTSVWGGQGREPTQRHAKLFAFNPNTGDLVWSMELPQLGDATAITSLVVTPNGRIWGATVNQIFEFDPVTRTVLRVKALTEYNWSWGPIWTSATLQVGSDGKVYGNVHGNVLRIDPNSWLIDMFARGASNFARDNAGNLYFARGYDLYRWRYTG